MTSVSGHEPQPQTNRQGDVSGDASPSPDFAQLLDLNPAAARLSYCRTSFSLHAPEQAECVPCAALTDPAVLTGLIDRFAARMPPADRRAIVSLLTLYYFSTLTIASAVAAFVLRRSVPLALDAVSLCIGNDEHAPLSFHIREIGPEQATIDANTALAPLLRDHLEPLIHALAAAGGVSKKLLWNNVIVYLSWILAEIAAGEPEGPAATAARLVRTKIWPDGWVNPMHDLLRPATAEDGGDCNRRKVCCLRYAVPGIGGCGQICPLPLGRA